MILRATFLIVGSLPIASTLLAPQTNAQTTYTLKPTPKTVTWGYYRAKTPPGLRVKSPAETAEIQALLPTELAQEERHPIIYVRHLEPPYYPPLARMTRVHGTILMKLRIGAAGKVLAIESESSDAVKSGFTMLKDDAERVIKTWTFGCVGCPVDTPFEHAIKFNYLLDNDSPPSTSKVAMDLPDEVTMSTGPMLIDHGGPAPKTSKKRSH